MANKLFIPGPTEVRKEILVELSHPQIGHRTQEFRDLFASLKPGLKELFFTNNDVLISTSSGSGFWEAAIRCCVNKKVLHAVNGAFSKKWADVSERCGREVTQVKFDSGKAVKADDIDKALSSGEFEAFCMVHNETSTGVASNLEDISSVMKKYPHVLFFVDAVSSLAGIKIEVDKLGIDICLASSQKALALPAGIAVASVSARAYKKAETVQGRGYYFDILELKKMYDKDETPYTPSIPHLYALKKQLERISAEGVENRFKRHKEMAEYVRKWALDKGFEMFAEKGYESNTVSCIANTKKLDFKAMKKEMAKKGYSTDSGYGKLNEKLEAKGKATTFRIAHMGDLTLDEVKDMLTEMERFF
ncbi:MAG: alanine--glyoxylate aminotransferase family protein [Nanoarchaeota archaeon]|nr:alanine--glyoxylate aminotransferase family protein [Nanoarchaeota archaeon]MBU1946216.1 alanine--glyoxylate aminotransferase family protein [Nanoarchaeota archaeon]